MPGPNLNDAGRPSTADPRDSAAIYLPETDSPAIVLSRWSNALYLLPAHDFMLEVSSKQCAPTLLPPGSQRASTISAQEKN